MFYHGVLLNLRDTSDEFLSRLGEFAERVRSELPYVHDFYFGRTSASRAAQFSWPVVATFDSEAHHERYQVSDAHLEMQAFLTPHIAEILVCDVETPASAKPAI